MQRASCGPRNEQLKESAASRSAKNNGSFPTEGGNPQQGGSTHSAALYCRAPCSHELVCYELRQPFRSARRFLPSLRDAMQKSKVKWVSRGVRKAQLLEQKLQPVGCECQHSTSKSNALTAEKSILPFSNRTASLCSEAEFVSPLLNSHPDAYHKIVERGCRRSERPTRGERV